MLSPFKYVCNYIIVSLDNAVNWTQDVLVNLFVHATDWREMKIDAPSTGLIDTHIHQLTDTHIRANSYPLSSRRTRIARTLSHYDRISLRCTYTSTLPHIPFQPESAQAASGSLPQWPLREQPERRPPSPLVQQLTSSWWRPHHLQARAS